MWSPWAGEMACQVKALAAKSDVWNSILDPHGGKGGGGVCRDGSVVKSSDCHFGGPGFGPCHPHRAAHDDL